MPVDPTFVKTHFGELTNIQSCGHGGFKHVLRADHPKFGSVVIKLIRPGSDPEELRREVLAPQAIGHTRIPAIYDSGCLTLPSGDLLWILEQAIDGPTVAEHLATNGPLPPNEVLRLGLHMLDALAAAETNSIVHRDVKPKNIMASADGSYWLIDFGIARHLNLHSITDDAQLWGKFTLGYAPREQMRNDKAQIDSRADLHALAVSLVEVATGIHPFCAGARSQLEIVQRCERVPLPPLRLALGHKSAELTDLVECMGAKRRDQRPRTVSEALEWMTEICAAEGIA